MQNIYIEGYHGHNFIPTVDFNAETGVCELEGESYLEDAIGFYAPLFKWLKTYVQEVRKPVYFNFKLRYFNTSSSKCIIDILHILKKYETDNGKVEIKWFYDADEDDVDDELEEVDDFMIETGTNIKLVPGRAKQPDS